jgi:hypothetical protein
MVEPSGSLRLIYLGAPLADGEATDLTAEPPAWLSIARVGQVKARDPGDLIGSVIASALRPSLPATAPASLRVWIRW